MWWEGEKGVVFATLWLVPLFLLLCGSSAQLNGDGLVLLNFRSQVEDDPQGVLTDWNSWDNDPCGWNGIRCVDGRVTVLYLREMSLKGRLGSELAGLTHLRALILSNNRFVGAIPTEISQMALLEILDLSDNELSGTIPDRILQMQSLKHLLLCNNSFQRSATWIQKENKRANLKIDVGQCCGSEKEKIIGNVRHRFEGVYSTMDHEKNTKNLPAAFPRRSAQMGVSISSNRRRLLLSNIPSPANSPFPGALAPVPSAGSGAFFSAPSPSERIMLPPSPTPAASAPTPTPTLTPSPTPVTNPPVVTPPIVPPIPQSPSALAPMVSLPVVNVPSNTSGFSPLQSAQTSGNSTKWYAIISSVIAFFVIATFCVFLVWRKKGVKAIGPKRTGISGQLQKAFVTGVPKLNCKELEDACEDFSNIVITHPHSIVYKGTLSSGVEIAVVSTVIPSIRDWSKHAEGRFRKKIDTLSRINHKNFVNLLGYCEEQDPFMRMMVFEYAPNGTLFDHLHSDEFDTVDWPTRTRIIMGVAYCIQHMHQLRPPVALPELQSSYVLLTEDNAAKIMDTSVWKELTSKNRSSEANAEIDHSEPATIDPPGNVYSFGILLLEIISGKNPQSRDGARLASLASEYMSQKRSLRELLDPELGSHKDDELDIICEVIQDCIHLDARQRPSMGDVTTRLREVIAISPEAAAPRLSPLWWAELEILSAEGS